MQRSWNATTIFKWEKSINFKLPACFKFIGKLSLQSQNLCWIRCLWERRHVLTYLEHTNQTADIRKGSSVRVIEKWVKSECNWAKTMWKKLLGLAETGGFYNPLKAIFFCKCHWFSRLERTIRMCPSRSSPGGEENSNVEVARNSAKILVPSLPCTLWNNSFHACMCWWEGQVPLGNWCETPLHRQNRMGRGENTGWDHSYRRG